jgi:ClpP class serine protease
MKQLPRIASMLYCEPWSILPHTHAEICRQFRDHISAGAHTPPEFAARVDVPRAEADDIEGPAYRDESGRIQAWHSQVQVIGTLAILPIRGIIGKHLSTLALWCGGCDSAVVARQARNIAADPRITDVIVLVDSPGGSCIGCVETAHAIRAISQAGKSTISYTDTMAASAGYFFAAACDQVAAAPSAIVGSISTYCAFLDESRAYEMEGLEVRMFKSGEVKGAGTPGKPWTEAEIADMQRVTDQFSEQFKSFIRRERGLGEDLMQGQYWPAEFAPSGLIDVLYDDLDALIRDITA